MTEDVTTGTASLLPRATVGVFARDKDLIATAQELGNDWRFARVTLDVQEGDVDLAIQQFQRRASPELIIIETQTTDESLTAKLEELAGFCREGTSAIVVGPVNDVYLYRRLIAMGISDYLVRPISRDVLADVIGKTLIEQKGATGSVMLAVAGSKGGVGASALAQGLAQGIATTLKQKTMLLDAAGGWSYTSVAMGTEPSTSLSEAVRLAMGDDPTEGLKRAVFRPNDRLAVLAGGMDDLLQEPATAETFERLLDRLMTTNPVLVVDLSQSSIPVRRMVMSRAHRILLVTVPTLPALRTTRSLLYELKDLRGGRDSDIDLVINQVGRNAAAEVSSADIVSTMERKPALTVEYDAKLFGTAESQGKMISDIKGGDKVVRDLAALVAPLVGESADTSAPAPSKDAGGSFSLGSLLGKFTSR